MNNPERVIVVIHFDGFVEIRATSNVLAVVVNRPEATTLEDEKQVDEMMQSIVPRQYQDLMLYAGDVIATANVERLTREQLADTIMTSGIMDALRSDPRQPKAEHIAWQRLGGMAPRRASLCPSERREQEEKVAE